VEGDLENDFVWDLHNGRGYWSMLSLLGRRAGDNKRGWESVIVR